MDLGCPLPQRVLLEFRHLLPLDNEALVDHAIPVIMPGVPGIKPASAHYRVQEACQPVRRVVSAELHHDAGGKAVGQNTVHLPAGFLQIPDRFLVIFLRGQFLRPPGDAFYPEHLPRPALEPIFPLKAGRRGVKDAVLDIVGGRAAHGEEGQPANFEDLPTHKMDHMGADIVDLHAVPGVNR